MECCRRSNHWPQNVGMSVGLCTFVSEVLVSVGEEEQGCDLHACV